MQALSADDDVDDLVLYDEASNGGNSNIGRITDSLIVGELAHVCC